MEKACLTTKDIIDNKGEIYSIWRDPDDEWQFFGKDAPNDEDIVVVSIEKIWQLFPDIKAISSELEKGFCAYKNNSEWKITKYDEE